MDVRLRFFVASPNSDISRDISWAHFTYPTFGHSPRLGEDVFYYIGIDSQNWRDPFFSTISTAAALKYCIDPREIVPQKHCEASLMLTCPAPRSRSKISFDSLQLMRLLFVFHRECGKTTEFEPMGTH